MSLFTISIELLSDKLVFQSFSEEIVRFSFAYTLSHFVAFQTNFIVTVAHSNFSLASGHRQKKKDRKSADESAF